MVSQEIMYSSKAFGQFQGGSQRMQYQAFEPRPFYGGIENTHQAFGPLYGGSGNNTQQQAFHGGLEINRKYFIG